MIFDIHASFGYAGDRLDILGMGSGKSVVAHSTNIGTCTGLLWLERLDPACPVFQLCCFRPCRRASNLLSLHSAKRRTLQPHYSIQPQPPKGTWTGPLDVTVGRDRHETLCKSRLVSDPIDQKTPVTRAWIYAADLCVRSKKFCTLHVEGTMLISICRDPLAPSFFQL